jgi:hypothetical protein
MMQQNKASNIQIFLTISLILTAIYLFAVMTPLPTRAANLVTEINQSTGLVEPLLYLTVRGVKKEIGKQKEN